MSSESRLHLACRNVFSRAPDHVFAAVNKVEHPAAVLRHDITRVKPSASPSRLGRVLVIQVATEKALARVIAFSTNQKLPRRVKPNILVVVINHPDLYRCGSPAKSTGMGHSGFMLVGQKSPRLSHAPHLNQGKTKALLECRVQGRVTTRSQSEADLMFRFPRSHILLDQSRRHDAKVVNSGGLRLDTILPPGAHVETIGQHQTVVGQTHGGDGGHATVHVKYGQRVEYPFAGMSQGQQPT